MFAPVAVNTENQKLQNKQPKLTENYQKPLKTTLAGAVHSSEEALVVQTARELWLVIGLGIG